MASITFWYTPILLKTLLIMLLHKMCKESKYGLRIYWNFTRLLLNSWKAKMKWVNLYFVHIVIAFAISLFPGISISTSEPTQVLDHFNAIFKDATNASSQNAILKPIWGYILVRNHTNAWYVVKSTKDKSDLQSMKELTKV